MTETGDGPLRRMPRVLFLRSGGQSRLQSRPTGGIIAATLAPHVRSRCSCSLPLPGCCASIDARHVRGCYDVGGLIGHTVLHTVWTWALISQDHDSCLNTSLRELLEEALTTDFQARVRRRPKRIKGAFNNPKRSDAVPDDGHLFKQSGVVACQGLSK